jgi:hypothetical protein
MTLVTARSSHDRQLAVVNGFEAALDVATDVHAEDQRSVRRTRQAAVSRLTL